MPSLKIPQAIQASTKYFVVGADECGVGCYAGPTVVCAVKAPKTWSIEGLNDSKKLSKKRRETMRDALNKEFEKGNIDFAIAERSNVQIDNVGIAEALNEAFDEAIGFVLVPSSLIVLDGNVMRVKLQSPDVDTVCIVKADTLVPAVMAASILAKTYRDEKMRELHDAYPDYDWTNNVGYGTPKHIAALKKFGLTPLHRRSYEPMRSMIG